MLFNSPEFLFGFLPFTLAGFFLLQFSGLDRFKTAFLTAASFFFYGWWSIRHVPLLGISIVLNFAFGMALLRHPRKWLLALAIGIDLLVLAYFKYADFSIASTNTALGWNLPLLHIILPIGISFYTFTQIAFLADAYRGGVGDRDPSRYALFVTFFPHLIAGPILHHREMTDQFREFGTRKVDATDLAIGISIFLIGLFKKAVLADSYIPHVGLVFDTAPQAGTLTTILAWTGALAFALQLYFDFSGYSDMAIGLARMIGIRMPENFYSPYKARSIADFWTRWHMTLSRFLRDYLYIPLGGNRHGFARSCINVVITMLLGGLWHGAAWTFVVWGGLHGAYIVIGRCWSRWADPQGARLPHLLAAGITFLAVLIAWVPFRAHDFASAVAVLTAMTGAKGLGTIPGTVTVYIFLGLAIVWLLPNTQQITANYRPVLPSRSHDAAPPTHLKWRLTPAYAAVLSLAVTTIIVMSNSGVTEFIYFQF